MTRKLLLGSALALGAMALAACGKVEPNGEVVGAGDAKICAPFTATANATVGAAPGVPGAPSAALAADASAAVDDCLHRWAYTLARSHDPADLVGRAAVAACASPLTTWNQQALGQGNGDAYSLTTGEPTNAISAHGDFAQARALFYVVQARAGNCAPPRASATANRATGY